MTLVLWTYPAPPCSTLPSGLSTLSPCSSAPPHLARPSLLRALGLREWEVFSGETTLSLKLPNGSAFPPEPDSSQRARRLRRAQTWEGKAPQGLAERREEQAGNCSSRPHEGGWRLAAGRTHCPSVPCASARALAVSRSLCPPSGSLACSRFPRGSKRLYTACGGKGDGGRSSGKVKLQ